MRPWHRRLFEPLELQTVWRIESRTAVGFVEGAETLCVAEHDAVGKGGKPPRAKEVVGCGGLPCRVNCLFPCCSGLCGGRTNPERRRARRGRQGREAAAGPAQAGGPHPRGQAARRCRGRRCAGGRDGVRGDMCGREAYLQSSALGDTQRINAEDGGTQQGPVAAAALQHMWQSP